jgi:predicted metal-dependent enzyme (double-stranded beta helix superfamily)
VLYVDPDGDFVITAITWLPGQVSPVHGHQVWCAYGVAEGELTEERFQEKSGILQTPDIRIYRPGDIADRDLDRKAIHRVSNRSRGTIVSLHLYGVSADRLTTGINRLYPGRSIGRGRRRRIPAKRGTGRGPSRSRRHPRG